MANMLDRQGAARGDHERGDHRLSALPPSQTAPPLSRALLAGLTAGSLAGIVAALVQLPLRSPDDIVLNSLTVVLAALVAGLAGGALWYALRGQQSPERAFLAVLAAAFLLVAAGALVADRLPNAPLSGIPGFVIPVAGIVLGGMALLTPLFARPAWRAALLGPVAAVVALGLGLALAGQGDADSGQLALPDAPSGQASGALLRPTDVAGTAFTVRPADSTVTYTVREKLASLPSSSNAVGKTSQVSGTIYLDRRPSTITVDVSSFQSDQPMRDNFIKNNPNGPQFSQYPRAQLVVSDLTLPTEYREGETVTQTVTGTMTIRGVSRPQSFNVEARMAGGVLTLYATTDFTWADYQIPPPNFAGFVQVEDTARIEALIVADSSR